MPEPFLSEIRIFSFSHAPAGWALCDGQLLPIAQNQALFALLGTVYGGDGETTFGVPDLRGQVPIHRGNGLALGEATGSSSVTLDTARMPQHAHALSGTAANGSTPNPTNGFLAGVNNLYTAPASTATMSPGSVTAVGGGQPHDNMMPYLALSFCMAREGSSPTAGGAASTPQPYVGEVRMLTGSVVPAGWMPCDGQLLAISGNETLFELIGTTYGGDGEESFALPNLQSRVPIHMGTGPDGIAYPISRMAGTEEVTLTLQQIPTHIHPLTASVAQGNQGSPAGNLLGESPGAIFPYIEDSPAVAMNAGSVSLVGGSQPHENCQPFLCINYVISLSGTSPTPT